MEVNKVYGNPLIPAADICSTEIIVMKTLKRPTIEEMDEAVQVYLENYKRTNEDCFSRLGFYKAKAADILKYLNNNEAAKRWKEGHLDNVLDSIDGIYENYILPFKFPVIKEATIIDAFIGRMLIKSGWWVLGNSRFFTEPITIEHVIKYLQRDNEIYEWNADFMYYIMKEYERVKEALVGEEYLKEPLFSVECSEPSVGL